MKRGAGLVTPGHLLSKSKVERDRIVINLTMGSLTHLKIIIHICLISF